jgi:hypothetical protein
MGPLRRGCHTGKGFPGDYGASWIHEGGVGRQYRLQQFSGNEGSIVQGRKTDPIRASSMARFRSISSGSDRNDKASHPDRKPNLFLLEPLW